MTCLQHFTLIILLASLPGRAQPFFRTGEFSVRQADEVIAFLVDPAGGFSRLIKGQWARRYPEADRADTAPLLLSFDAGLRKYNVNDQNPFRDGHLGLYGRIRFEFGSPDQNRKTPFSHLSIMIEGGKDDSSKINIVSVYGSLYGWQISCLGVHADLSISGNYEYINNQAFFYGAQSVRANLYKEFSLSKKIRVFSTVAAGPILLAAVPDAHTFENRNYDYGPGLSFNAAVRLEFGRLSYRFALRGGWTKTIGGNRSDYFLHAFTNELDLRIFDKISLGAEEGYFSLHAHYNKFPHISRTYPYCRIALKYRLSL